MAALSLQLVVAVLAFSTVYYVASAYPILGHTQGQPWPMPRIYKPTTVQQSLNKEKFRFAVRGYDCDILEQAIRRYYGLVFYPGAGGGEAGSRQAGGRTALRFEPHGSQWGRQRRAVREMKQQHNAVTDLPVLQSLDVLLTQPCDKYPSLKMDESYDLSVQTGAAKLMTNSIWGALRGLETFSQIAFEADNSMILINNTEISDSPRFPHRGAMLDTSRHFVPKSVLLQNLDAMTYNKLNVFHWHIVDDESFPYQSRTFPELSNKGAWEPYTHIYTQEDIVEVLEYARMRGIRVIPEFDTPGHSQSWGKGQPDLLTECCTKGVFNGNYGPIDPSKESTYTFLQGLFTELRSVFKDHYLHLGGDEVSFSCWQSNPNITDFMKAQNFTTYGALESYYENRVLDILNKLGSGYMVWQEVVDNGCKVRPDTVVHIWKSGADEMAKVTKMGLQVIMSTPWYLNYISYGVDWKKYYQYEPLDFNGTAAQKALVMGGELCMWGEYVDGTNLIARIWPRGSAVAERLWSPVNVTDTSEATPRLEEHRCRQIRRGLSAEPVSGPGFCRWEYVPRN